MHHSYLSINFKSYFTSTVFRADIGILRVYNNRVAEMNISGTYIGANVDPNGVVEILRVPKSDSPFPPQYSSLYKESNSYAVRTYNGETKYLSCFIGYYQDPTTKVDMISIYNTSEYSILGNYTTFLFNMTFFL